MVTEDQRNFSETPTRYEDKHKEIMNERLLGKSS